MLTVSLFVFFSCYSATRWCAFLLHQGELAKYKIPAPEHVFFTGAPLPRGATGKVCSCLL